jgi:hypothetical protein
MKELKIDEIKESANSLILFSGEFIFFKKFPFILGKLQWGRK